MNFFMVCLSLCFVSAATRRHLQERIYHEREKWSCITCTTCSEVRGSDNERTRQDFNALSKLNFRWPREIRKESHAILQKDAEAHRILTTDEYRWTRIR